MVVMLLETPFRRWHSDNKNDLLKVGKPIPILSALAPDKKLSKVFCRSFNPNLYQQHSWLCGSHYIQKLFCWPCLLLGKIKSVWNTVGYYDLKNLSRGIQIHQTSKEHIHNHLGLKNLEKNYFSILDVVNEHGNLFKKNYNENVRLNRLFMEHLIDLVLFLGKQELAFRGHDENSDSLNKGNFRELFDMHIIRCSQEIQNHYNSIKNIFSGMSKSIQNDLISCISEFLINQIKNEIKQCKFYSIQIDDTTDISQKTQCSIIIRYVTDKSELVERFLGFHNVSEDRTAQGSFNLVNSVLHEFDIENKLVGQCYDGACVMSGHLTGLQARVKEVAPNALFTHCLAHRLNLVLQHGCSINAKCRIFFANLTGIAAYFHNSTSRTNFVDTIVGKRIPQFVQTRWSSRSKILHTIVNEWSGFINVFDCISKDPKSSFESICGAIGHFKNLITFEFAFLALVFNDFFIYTDNLFNILQNKSFDVEFCLRKINITYDLINKKRNEPEFLKLFNQAVTLTKPPKATRNESNNQSNFKILFYEIIDNILMQLNTKFQDTNKLLFLQLADVTKFKEYSCTFPVNALNNLKSTYPNIFYNINTLKVELEVLYSDVKYQNLLHIYDMVKIIEQDALKDILPEAYKLFILILTIPSTSISNERIFSCLKRIKTCSRNSISQVRLSSLLILSIEKSLINQLKKTESFYDDIIIIRGLKRKIDSECRVFNEKWSLDYFVIYSGDKIICLICKESISVLKEYNIRRHYETKHKTTFSKFTEKLRLDKLQSLQNNFSSQQLLFKKQKKINEAATKASFRISHLLAKRGKAFSDGSLIKECIIQAVEEICPERIDTFKNISLSANTVTRRIDDIKYNLKWEILKCITTDGGRNMCGTKKGLIGQIFTNCEKEGFKPMTLHCIIHQQALCGKTLDLSCVMDPIISTVNFIRSSALRHRQFQDFLKEIETEYPDIPYFTAVRWLKLWFPRKAVPLSSGRHFTVVNNGRFYGDQPVVS
ncbi:hypothetical protein QTP88_011686 [Uroleucon formosanum]